MATLVSYTSTQSQPSSMEGLNISGTQNQNQVWSNLVDLFPQDLVNAMGRGYLEKIPQIERIKSVTFDHMPELGAIKGTDEMERLFVAFVVRNPQYKEVKSDFKWGIEEGYPIEEMIITLTQNTTFWSAKIQALMGFGTRDTNAFSFQRHYQKDAGGMTQAQIQKLGYFVRLGHLTHLPTNDCRLLTSQPLGKDQYEAIREIFEGRHKDLRLVNRFSQSVEDKLRRKEQELGPCMDRFEVKAILSAYREELLRQPEQFPATQRV